MSMSLDLAAEVFREAMRETVKRYSLWYLVEGVLLVVAGVLAIIYPVISSGAVVFLLGWLLIASGLLQGLSLIGARQVPHFWLQLISVILAILIGFLFLRDTTQGLMTLALLLIIFFMMEGISKVVFALTIRTLGLAFAGPLAMIVGSFASDEVRWKETIIFAVAMTAFCILLFKVALGLPIPVVAFM